MQKTFYDLLEVSPRATTNEIKAAFRKKAQQVHPDKIQAQIAALDPYAAERLKKALEEDFRDLKEAYDVLSNTRQRKEYDDLLKQIQAASTSPAQPSPPSSSPAATNYCAVCGATLVGNSCPSCAKPKAVGVAVSAVGAFLLVIGSIFGFFVAITVPRENSWDSDTCGGILVVLGILVFWAMKKGAWGGIKRVRKTRPVLLAAVVEGCALVVLSLVVGVYNSPPKAASTATKTASLPLTTAAAKPPDCLEMRVAHNVDIGPHTYSVGRLVCVTAYTDRKYYSPQDKAWFDESDLSAVTPPPQAVPTKSPAHTLTGQFGGTVRNETAGLSADFGIAVKEDRDFLSGCMVVKPPLFGSGPLSGTVNGSDVTFIVLSSIGGIFFTGQREGGTLHGTYTVRHLSGSLDEKGTFALRQSRSGMPGFDSNVACSKLQPQVTPTPRAISQQARPEPQVSVQSSEVAGGTLIPRTPTTRSALDDDRATPSPQRAELDGYFSIGSTKNDVLTAQGTPTEFSDSVWKYGSSSIYFMNGRVTSWNIWPGSPLRAKMLPSTPVRVVPSYFTVGSSKDDVLSVQGTPTEFNEASWKYGASTVYFANSRVTNWDIWPGSPLRVRMMPSTSVSSSGYFTIGSTKDEVLSAQGTPTEFNESSWKYGASTVYFKDGRVVSWDVWPGSPLKVRMEPTHN
jgi:rubrerythrin